MSSEFEFGASQSPKWWPRLGCIPDRLVLPVKTAPQISIEISRVFTSLLAFYCSKVSGRKRHAIEFFHKVNFVLGSWYKKCCRWNRCRESSLKTDGGRCAWPCRSRASSLRRRPSPSSCRGRSTACCRDPETSE